MFLVFFLCSQLTFFGLVGYFFKYLSVLVSQIMCWREVRERLLQVGSPLDSCMVLCIGQSLVSPVLCLSYDYLS